MALGTIILIVVGVVGTALTGGVFALQWANRRDAQRKQRPSGSDQTVSEPNRTVERSDVRVTAVPKQQSPGDVIRCEAIRIDVENRSVNAPVKILGAYLRGPNGTELLPDVASQTSYLEGGKARDPAYIFCHKIKETLRAEKVEVDTVELAPFARDDRGNTFEGQPIMFDLTKEYPAYDRDYRIDQDGRDLSK